MNPPDPTTQRAGDPAAARATRDAWERGIERELAFWRDYLASGGLWEPEACRFRFDPDSALQPHIAVRLPAHVPASELAILDCAAGPATTLGKTLHGERLQIVAIDALAERYAEILRDLHLEPPVPTRPGEVEWLDCQFPAAGFSLVYMRFALDHLYDPILGLRQMVKVTRPGGTVMIEHYRDEREVEYAGLKQWTLTPMDGDLVIHNPTHRFSVRQEIQGVQLEVDARPDWLTVFLTKDP